MITQQVLKRPIITERATALTERHNQVIFEVACAANKHQIRDAVETVYGVKVVSVHTMTIPGKLKRRGSSVGKRPNWKKAIVKLVDGDVIDFFATE
ncbi:MAG: 50S ribosomal protein L23 [Deltaproteobacteria bacterium RIFOXYA12_FULL_58_15]|nr:MAG: 50S ribosomal protein L23 [Deltaproteobacteria bacterium RIFOXYA12_FULL_58_15]OGR15342.1 MAG: 50S ribosomal protein L23 [Deltaproteobacteria bacterium RIFOXYB12_FULL_58_9]